MISRYHYLVNMIDGRYLMTIKEPPTGGYHINEKGNLFYVKRNKSEIYTYMKLDINNDTNMNIYGETVIYFDSYKYGRIFCENDVNQYEICDV